MILYMFRDTGSLGLVHCDDPEGWDGEGGGRGVQDGEYVYTRGGFMLMNPIQYKYNTKPIQYCKVKKKRENVDSIKNTDNKKKLAVK